MYTLRSKVVLPAPAAEVWSFIATPLNLNRITPPELAFETLSELPDTMFSGLLIQYRIRLPLLGHRRWITEIKHTNPGRSFVDEQRMGPYAFWYHWHEIEALGPQKTLMKDQVFYRLPFGIVGRLVHRFWVDGMLQEIFRYRQHRLKEIFSA